MNILKYDVLVSLRNAKVSKTFSPTKCNSNKEHNPRNISHWRVRNVDELKDAVKDCFFMIFILQRETECPKAVDN